MRFFASLVLAAGFAATPSFADTIDRINACEQAGGGACVFQILRELAAGQGQQTPSPLQGGTYQRGDGWSHQILPNGPGSFVLSWNGGSATYTCNGAACVSDHSQAAPLRVESPTRYNMDGSIYTRTGD